MTALLCNWIQNHPEDFYELFEPLLCFLFMAIWIDFAALASMVDLPRMVGIE